jgi:hypothetical protein
MMTPHFLPLAQIDDQHFITACRHGVVHLTLGRVTLRLRQDEFRRLVALLEQAGVASPPTSLRDGDLRITSRPDEDCELQMGSLILLLAPAKFGELVQAAQEALNRLDKVLASGAWDEPEAEETASNPLEQFRRVPFSRN